MCCFWPGRLQPGYHFSIDINLELANALAESGEVSNGLVIYGHLLKEFPENQGVIRTLSTVAFEGHTIRQKPPRNKPMFQKPVLTHS